jgi:hypothetical protein
MRLPPLRPYFRRVLAFYITFALLGAQYEVATSASILPSGVEFYITCALLGAQYEVATSASVLPSGVEFYITFALLGAQYEVATPASILPSTARQPKGGGGGSPQK